MGRYFFTRLCADMVAELCSEGYILRVFAPFTHSARGGWHEEYNKNTMKNAEKVPGVERTFTETEKLEMGYVPEKLKVQYVDGRWETLGGKVLAHGDEISLGADTLKIEENKNGITVVKTSPFKNYPTEAILSKPKKGDIGSGVFTFEASDPNDVRDIDRPHKFQEGR